MHTIHIGSFFVRSTQNIARSFALSPWANVCPVYLSKEVAPSSFRSRPKILFPIPFSFFRNNSWPIRTPTRSFSVSVPIVTTTERYVLILNLLFRSPGSSLPWERLREESAASTITSTPLSMDTPPSTRLPPSSCSERTARPSDRTESPFVRYISYLSFHPLGHFRFRLPPSSRPVLRWPEHHQDHLSP